LGVIENVSAFLEPILKITRRSRSPASFHNSRLQPSEEKQYDRKVCEARLGVVDEGKPNNDLTFVGAKFWRSIWLAALDPLLEIERSGEPKEIS
jgi:hypothetical protein